MSRKHLQTRPEWEDAVAHEDWRKPLGPAPKALIVPHAGYVYSGQIDADQACGCRPIRGLLYAAHAHGLHAVTLDLRNSGDRAGPRDQVVGYGAFAFN